MSVTSPTPVPTSAALKVSAQLIETWYTKIGDVVSARTTITQIGFDKPLSPQSTLWVIVNDGDYDIWIDNSYKIVPGDRFGIDHTTLIPVDQKFRNDTTFKVRFA